MLNILLSPKYLKKTVYINYIILQSHFAVAVTFTAISTEKWILQYQK